MVVLVVRQLRFVLAAQGGKLRLPNTLDLGFVDQLLFGYVVSMRRLWTILGFR